MPISRATIFVTNTIGGILLLILMMGISAFLIFLVSELFTSLVIPFKMIVDYFISFSIIYVFVFTICNLAASVSGNVMTQIVVTLLIMFLVPFLSQMSLGFFNNEAVVSCSSSSCAPKVYECYDNFCLNDKENGIYKASSSIYTEAKYTAPYQFVSSIIFGNNFTFGKSQLGKMFFLSLVYIVLGYVLFKRRSMEVTETSFRNIYVHMFVKSLTIIPMVFLFDAFMFSSDFGWPLVIVLLMILAYFFVYDLITKKSITNIRLSLVFFIITTLLVTGFYYLTNVKENTTYIDRSKVSSVALDLSEFVNMSDVYISSSKVIDWVFQDLLSSNYSRQDSYVAYLKMNNGTVYELPVSYSENYNKILKYVNNNKDISTKFKDIPYSQIYFIKADNLALDPNSNSKIISLVKSSMENLSLSSYNALEDNGFILNMRAYSNGRIVTYQINTKISPELTRKISSYFNEEFKKNTIDKDNMHTVYVDNHDDIYYPDMDYFTSNCSKDLWNFIKTNINKDCDITKPYIKFEYYSGNGSYAFYTNNISGFSELISSLREKVKDLPDYQDYLSSLSDDDE